MAVPAFHLTVEVDMTHAPGTRERTSGATVTDALLAACDYRAVDGATGAAFLAMLRELLQG